MMHGPWMVLLVLGLGCTGSVTAQSNPAFGDFDQPPHLYWTRPLQDPFTRLKADLESGRLKLDASSERAYVLSLLKTLDIPASSQMLVFSTTSLQLRFISPSNPRALYFNENLYLGYIPGGRVEIVSLDPELGGIYYIFDIPRDATSPRVERSDRCMNCHASEQTGQLPGLILKSVVPGPGGGSLVAYRQDETGHAIPFDQRFGGWHVTGHHSISNHWGNLLGRLSTNGLTTQPLEPGRRFDFTRYPVMTSDILPHLLHEHQVGFVNRTIEASYRARMVLHQNPEPNPLSPAQSEDLDRQAHALTRYLLFADEVSLPGDGVKGDPAFQAEFLRNKHPAHDGSSLKDLELRTRLFKYRCSYMIYTDLFQALPRPMKDRVYQRLASALNVAQPDPEYAYLPPAEKRAIHTVLKQTLPGLPKDW